MAFLVRSENRLTVARRDELQAAENTRAMESRAQAVLKPLWRVPGRNATVSPSETDDAAGPFDGLISLAMAAWLNVHVEALATEPQERT